MDRRDRRQICDRAVNWPAALAQVDKRALLSSLLIASLAFAALALLVDRLTRLAKAEALGGETVWQARIGEELRLKGLEGGPVLAIETGGGEAMTVRAGPVRLDDGSKVRELIWLVSRAEGETEGDNKASLLVATAADDSDLVLSRGGDEVVPQLQVEAGAKPLRLEAGVTIGDRLVMPSIRILADGQEVQPLGMGVAFALEPGGSAAVEFPALPDGTPAGVTAVLGANDPAESRRGGWRLKMTEATLADEDEGAARTLACAAPAGSYAFDAFLRLDLAPLPAGGDCKPGHLSAHSFGISRDAVSVGLRGSAFVFEDGKPTASLWSWAKANPVLDLLVGKAVPAAVGLISGWVTFRRTARPKPKPKPKPKTEKKPKAPTAKRKPPVKKRARG
jgi:hypothetical protein